MTDFNPFAEAKKEAAQMNRPKTTLIQVEDYELGESNRDSYIKGLDLLNKNEDGTPKQVNVYVNNMNSNVMGVKNFASKKSLVATQKGGIIRVDRAREKVNGDLETPHLQRICEDGNRMREDESGNKAKIGIQDAWVKVRPHIDNNTGNFRNYETKKGPQHRASVFVLPADYEEESIKGTDPKFMDQLKDLASKALDNAPAGTRAMLRPRVETANQTQELVINNMRQDSEGNMVTLSKEDAIEGMLNNNYNQAMLSNLQKYDGSIHFAKGFMTSAFGGTTDDNGNPRTSRVEEFASQSLRRFAEPDANGNVKARHPGQHEYVRALISVEVPENDRPSHMATMGRHPRTTASPVGHTDHVSVNPYAPQWEQLRQQREQAQAQQTQNQGMASAGQTATAGATATAAAYQAQAPTSAATGPAGNTEEPPMPNDDDVLAVEDLASLGDMDDDLGDVPDLGGPK